VEFLRKSYFFFKLHVNTLGGGGGGQGLKKCRAKV